MTRMKKLMALFVSAALVLALLAGCGTLHSRKIASALNAIQKILQVETSDELDNALRQAVQAGGDLTTIRNALLDALDQKDAVYFSRNGIRSAHTGQHAIQVYKVTGGSASNAAKQVAQNIADILVYLYTNGEYQGTVSMVEKDGDYYIAIDLTIVKAGNSGGGSQRDPITGVDPDIDDTEPGDTVDGSVPDPNPDPNPDPTPGTTPTDTTLNLPSVSTGIRASDLTVYTGNPPNSYPYTKGAISSVENAFDSTALKQELQAIIGTEKNVDPTTLSLPFANYIWGIYSAGKTQISAEGFHNSDTTLSGNAFSSIDALEDTIKNQNKVMYTSAYLFADGTYNSDKTAEDAITGLLDDLYKQIQEAEQKGSIHKPGTDLNFTMMGGTYAVRYSDTGTWMGIVRIDLGNGQCYYCAVLRIVAVAGDPYL